MIQLHLPQQQTYSRGQALLRAFFGWLYLGIPGALLTYIYNFVNGILAWIAWWIVVFTGEFPKGLQNFMLDIEVSVIRWYVFMLGMRDGYPEVAPSQDANVISLLPREWEYSRGRALLLVLLMPLYTMIYGVVAILLWVVLGFVSWMQFFIVVFTGNMNEGLYNIMYDCVNLTFTIRLFLFGVYQKFPGLES
jgi:hypothetical protein